MTDSNIITEEQDFDTLGGRISRARQAVGMDTSTAARNLGVDLKTIECWETDSLEPRSSRLNQLAGILGVSATWLLQGTGTAPRGEVENTEIKLLQAQAEQLDALASEMMERVQALKTSIRALDTSRSDD